MKLGLRTREGREVTPFPRRPRPCRRPSGALLFLGPWHSRNDRTAAWEDHVGRRPAASARDGRDGVATPKPVALEVSTRMRGGFNALPARVGGKRCRKLKGAPLD